MSTAGDGLTEPNLYLLPVGADANESLPAYKKEEAQKPPFLAKLSLNDTMHPWKSICPTKGRCPLVEKNCTPHNRKTI